MIGRARHEGATCLSISAVAVAIGVAIAGCRGDTLEDAHLFVHTAPSLNYELEYEGRAEQVAVAPDGRIWLALGGSSQIIVGDSVAGPWRHAFYQPFRERSGQLEIWLNPIVSVLSFFSPDTLLAAGVGDNIYRTTDAGVRWDTVSLGDVSFIDAAFSLGGGLAWVGGQKDRERAAALLATTDYGGTWTQIPTPFESRVSSIFMETSEVAAVAGLWNKLARTADGGLTWTELPTPLDQSAVPDTAADERRNLEAVALVGERLVVRQGDRVFHSWADSIVWRLLPGGARFFAYDRREGRLYGVDTANVVLAYDDEMNARPINGAIARGDPIHMAARSGRVVVLEREGAVLQVGPDGVQYGFPLAQSGTWRIARARRIGDRLWGVTAHHIYTSMDMGASWDRVGFTPTAIRGFRTSTRGDLLLWNGHGRNVIYDPQSGTLRPLEGLRGYDVVDIVDSADKWIAFGGRQYETTARVEVSRTFFSGQFAGSREHGFVMVSDDEGEHWEPADEWQDAGVANIFVDPITEDMVLVSYLGGVRRLSRTVAGYTAEDLILPSRETWDSVPYVEVPSVVYFETERRGFIDGWTHQLGERRYETRDGGRKWVHVPTRDHEVHAIPASNGYLTLMREPPFGHARLVFRVGGDTVPVWAPEPPDSVVDPYAPGGITDFSVDEEGRILVVVDGTEFFALEVPEVGLLSRPDPTRRR